MNEIRKNIEERIKQDLTYDVTNFIMTKVIQTSFEYFVAAKTKDEKGGYKKVGHIDPDLEDYFWDEFSKLWTERNGAYPVRF